MSCPKTLQWDWQSLMTACENFLEGLPSNIAVFPLTMNVLTTLKHSGKTTSCVYRIIE